MLLHIFHVDTGTMVKFDVNLALENVSRLKEEVERKCCIPCDKQVLLASGGQNLEPSERVSVYSAGTDTSPIFLFSKSSIESLTPPIPTVDYGPDPDLKDEINNSLNLPPTITTVRLRSLLAQRLCDIAKEQKRICDNLVHDQHLQQQGWAAVIANLDDITALFRTRSESIQQNFKQHLETRDQFIEILESFETDMETLSKIPVLPALLENDFEEGTVQHGPLTLLQWISAKDQQASIQQLAEQCRKGMKQFDEKVLEALMADVRTCLESAMSTEMRVIRGLEDRLFGLDKLRCEVHNIVSEQTDLAHAFALNQNSVTNLGGDESILPDLCLSHRQQLLVMLKNHQQLRDIRMRCVKAKQELATNLFHRLKWVMCVESRVMEVDGRLLMYHESVKKLRQHLEVLQQLHTAPSMYLTAVTEVVRRRTFSQAFLMWGTDVSCQVCAIHTEEVARRKMFHSQFQGHFLSSLFPGLDDLPPPFATHPPPLFDSNLPKLSLEDVECLRSHLPDLALSLSLPDLTSITQFFLTRSKSDPNQPDESIQQKIVEVVEGMTANLDTVASLLQPTDNSQSSAQSATQPISDRIDCFQENEEIKLVQFRSNVIHARGFESETDTEDLDNITTGPCDMPLLKKGRKRKEGGSESEVRKVNVSESVVGLRSQVGDLREWVLCQRSKLHHLLHTLSVTCSQHNQLLIEELKMKEGEMQRLQATNAELEEQLKRSLEREERERAERERLVEEARQEAVSAVTDKLTQQHRAELDANRLRCRMVYSTSHSLLERSTSESSLERIDRGEFADRIDLDVIHRDEYIEKSKHLEIVEQLRKDLIEEKEREMKELSDELDLKMKQYNQMMFNETMRKVILKQEREKEDMRTQEMGLSSQGPRLSQDSGMSQSTLPMEEAEQDRPCSPQSVISQISSSVSVMQADGSSRDVTISPETSPKAGKMKDKLVNS